MAVITKTLIVGGGGDYTSLATWESTEQTNLVTATNTHVLNCSPGEEDVGTGQFTLAGWTTNATYFITIQGTSPPAMPWSATSTYTLRTSYAGAGTTTAFSMGQTGTVVKDVQFHLDAAAITRMMALTQSTTFESVIWRADGFRIYPGPYAVAAITLWFYNCIMWCDRSGNSEASPLSGMVMAGNSTSYIVGCMVYINATSATVGTGIQMATAGTDVFLYNTAIFNYDRAYFDVDWVAGTTLTDSNCATSLPAATTQLATNRQVELTDAWTDAANIDFSFTTAAKLRNVGMDVSSYTVRDILGTTRPGEGVYDIGVYEYVPSSQNVTGIIAGATGSVIAPALLSLVLYLAGVIASVAVTAINYLSFSGTQHVSGDLPSAQASTIPPALVSKLPWMDQLDQADPWTDAGTPTDPWTDASPQTDSWS
jgi:hypothetical protein